MLFELPAVAHQKLAGDPVAGRMQMVAGDFFTGPIPDGVEHLPLVGPVSLLVAETA